MSRTQYFFKNFIWLGISTVLSSLVTFITRTIFIKVLGNTVLGLNDLVYSIVAMLSLTELGIGSAITFCLYKPLAEKDYEHLQALMNFYRKAYRFVALVIVILGLCIVPFLPYIVKESENIINIYFVFIIFLFNTALSYLFTYKTTILVADQRKYLLTNIYMIISVLTLIIQSIVLIIFKNYYIYLFIEVFINFTKNFFVNRYVDKRFPKIFCKNNSKISKEEEKSIFSKIKAMLLYKLSEVFISQTDNIIISMFIGVTTIAYKGNYYLIINLIKRFTTGFFNSASAGLGNMIASENKNTSLQIFNAYNFISFWLYGFVFVIFYFSIDNLICIWIGKDNILPRIVVFMFCLDFFLSGIKEPFKVLKEASGMFEKDTLVCILMAIVNLGISIVGGYYIGLPGVVLGTIISGLIPIIARPLYLYKEVLNISAKYYYKDLSLFMLFLVVYVSVSSILLNLLQKLFASQIIYTIIVLIYNVIVFNIVVMVIYRKNKAFTRLIEYLKRFINLLLFKRR